MTTLDLFQLPPHIAIGNRNYKAAWAEFSEDRMYRYLLGREWRSPAARVLYVMLNPSSAGADRDDATIRRCVGFAEADGYGSLEVVNLYGFISTEPAALPLSPDPIGPRNDAYVRDALTRANLVVVAWGTAAFARARGEEFVARIAKDRTVYCLRITKDGHPEHPVRLPKACKFTVYRSAGQ